MRKRRTAAVVVGVLLGLASTSSADRPFSIKDSRLLETRERCTTRVKISTSSQGYSLSGKVQWKDGTPLLWCPGARHTWEGISGEIQGGAISRVESSEKRPLVFQITRQGEYVYEGGEGTVVLPDGTSIVLPATAGAVPTLSPQPTASKVRVLGAEYRSSLRFRRGRRAPFSEQDTQPPRGMRWALVTVEYLPEDPKFEIPVREVLVTDGGEHVYPASGFGGTGRATNEALVWLEDVSTESAALFMEVVDVGGHRDVVPRYGAVPTSRGVALVAAHGEKEPPNVARPIRPSFAFAVPRQIGRLTLKLGTAPAVRVQFGKAKPAAR